MTPHRLLRIRLATLVALGGLLISAGTGGRVLAGDAPKIAGNWSWSWKDTAGETHRHLLEVEGLLSKLAARERFDDLPAVRVTDLKLNGKTLRFTVVRDQKRAEYKGVLADDGKTINGTVTVTTDDQSNEFPWKATREPTTPKEPEVETP